MIIILGSKEEFHSRYIFELLLQRGKQVKYFDSRNYPIISWTPECVDNYIILDEEKIYIRDVTGLYWRWYYGVTYLNNDIVYKEQTSALESFLGSMSEISYNSFRAIQLHRTKGLQTKIMKENNIRIPKTLVTNDKNALLDFYYSNDKNIIFKPVQGGAFTKIMTDKDLSRVDNLVNCPCQLQEFVDGVDIRVYAFESGEVFAGEIIAKHVDFRQDNEAVINPVKLPSKVEKDCLKILKLLELKYSGIDIRLSKSGEYVFLEANPAPMFYHFENMSKHPITETLIKNLVGNE